MQKGLTTWELLLNDVAITEAKLGKIHSKVVAKMILLKI